MRSREPSWEYVPGILELIDEGAGSPEDVADREYAAPTTRGNARELWDWLRGFRRGQVLCERAPVWVPLAELWPAPGSTAELTYEVAQERERNAVISIAPMVGFGGFSRHELAREITLSADRHGVAYETRVHLTIIEYVNERTGRTVQRVDVDVRDGTPEFNARDLTDELRPWGDKVPTIAEVWADHSVVHIEHRADLAAASVFRWTSKGTRSWSVKTALDVMSAPAALELTATCQRSEGFAATFTLPGRTDYALCAREGEVPIVPLLVPVAPG